MQQLVSLDIIICTYNNAQLLKRTLESLTQQVVSEAIEWQVVVVNNNCTDETNEVVQDAMRQRTMQLRMICEKEQGLTAARLCGVRNTKSAWLAFVDDDSILASDWVEQTAAFAKAHPQCGAFGGRISLLFEDKPPAYIHRFPFAYAGKDHGSVPFKRKWLAGLGMTVRRKALYDTGWVNQPLLDDRIGKKLVSGGDMEIGLLLSTKYEIWYNPSCLITHIIPMRRTTRQYLSRMLFGLAASRHNVAALTWRRNYPLFLLNGIAVSAGFFIKGILDSMKDLFSIGKRAGYSVSFSPVFGWISAMLHMLKMNNKKRNRLLGAIYQHQRTDS